MRLTAAPLLSSVFVMALSPILYEGTLLMVAGWQGLFGASCRTSRPPMLDFALESTPYHSASFDAPPLVPGRLLHATPWKSQYVIPFAIFWTGVLAMSLRRT